MHWLSSIQEFLHEILHLTDFFILTPEILRAPVDTTVFLDQSSVFTCETSGGVPGWRVNGTPRENLPPEILSDLSVTHTTTAEGTTVKELTITARAEYNGTRAQCVVLAIGGSAESENATLKIQGIIAHAHMSVCVCYIQSQFSRYYMCVQRNIQSYKKGVRAFATV